MTYTITVHAVPTNSARHRVVKGSDGLWHVWLTGTKWIAAYGKWENAMRCATTGRVW